MVNIKKLSSESISKILHLESNSSELLFYSRAIDNYVFSHNIIFCARVLAMQHFLKELKDTSVGVPIT